MKKLTIAAAAIAVTCATAQAQSETRPTNSDFFVAYSAGYLFDHEDLLHTVRAGFDKGCTSYYLQVGYSEIDDSGIDSENTSISLGLMGRKYFDSNISGYIGASVGVGKIDIDVDAFNFSDDDTGLYFDVVAGLEREFTSRLSGNLGLRYLYFDGFDKSGIDSGSLDDVAIEAGLKISF